MWHRRFVRDHEQRAANGELDDRVHGFGRARPVQPRAQIHDVAAGDQFLRVGNAVLVEFETGEHPVDDRGVVDIEQRIGEPERIQRFDCSEEALRVGVETRGSDQFEAGLRHLAHAAFLRILVAIGRGDVRETQRKLCVAHARRDESCDGRRHLRTERDLRAAPIGEEKEPARHVVAQAGFECVEALEIGGLDFGIRPPLEHGA